MRARMTLRYGLVVPATAAGFDGAPGKRPTPASPHRLSPTSGSLLHILGEAEWVVRLVPVLGGFLLFWTLYRLVRRFWSDTTAVLAMLLYITLPFMCSFSVLLDLMFLEMASCLFGRRSLPGVPEPARRASPRALSGLHRPGARWPADGRSTSWPSSWACTSSAGGSTSASRSIFSDGGGRRWRLPIAPLRWLFATFIATILPFGFHFLFTWRVGMFDEAMGLYRERSTASYSWVYAQISSG